MSAPLTALVVGAGVGGLTAALALARAGLLVTVVEQAAALGEVGAGLELLLADAGLAERLANPAFPLAERITSSGLRTRLGDLELGELEPGAWRPVTPRELERLRRGARLPPRAG